VLEFIYYYTGRLSIVEMDRRRPLPPPGRHLYQQQPLDLIASVRPMTEREQQMGSNGVAVTDDSRLASQCRHWRRIVHVIFVVSLLFNVTVINVVWWQWNAGCRTAQRRCPFDRVSLCTICIVNSDI